MKHTNLAGDLTEKLAGDIVAKNFCHYSKTDLTIDIAEEKKSYHSRSDFTGDIAGDHVAKNYTIVEKS
jgi:hypothetical protein